MATQTEAQTKKSNDFLVLGVTLALLIIINGVLLATSSLKLNWDGFGTMVGAGLTIAIFSFLYKDNPLFKFGEHLYVGASAAYLFHMVWYDNIIRDVFQPLFVPSAGTPRNLMVLIPTFLGIFLLMRAFKGMEFLSRITFAFVTGFAAGQAIPNSITTWLLEQIGPTIQPLFSNGQFNFDIFVILCGVISVLVYFFFSLEHKGIVGKVSRVGIWFIMISFGASFGYTVMARMSLLIGRVNFMFTDWIPLIK